MFKKHTIKTTFNLQKLLILGWSSFVAIGIGIVGFSSIVPDSTNATTQISADISNRGYYLDLSSSADSINMDITPSATDEVTAATDQVTVKTNIPSGYRLYISAVQNSLYNTYTAPKKETTSIPATSKTPTSADTLGSNQWGYGIPSATEGLPKGHKFSDSYSTPSTLDSAHWAGVPTTKDQPIQTIDHANDALGGNKVNIYYGVNVNSGLASGTYTGNIVYTAIADVPEPPTMTFDMAYAQAGKSKATAADGNEYYQMKDMDTSICNAVTAPASTSAEDTQTGTLVDTRDGKTYQVAKLLDGNCWMTENLRLGSGTQSYNLTSADSNVSSDWTLPAMPTSTSWTATYTEPMLYPSDDQNTDSAKGALGYYGYYYNWNAATAGTGVQSAAHTTADICPKGWSLPSNYTVNPDRSYAKLLVDYGVISDASSTFYATDGYTKMTTAPLQFVLSGYHADSGDSGTSVSLRDSYGFYWSSSSYNPTDAYYLNFNNSSVRPQYSYNKKRGIVVRCLAL